MLRVEERFEVESESPHESFITPYDTFDWRMYGNGYFAYATPTSFNIQESLAPSPFLEREMRSVPRFWWEFKDDRLRALLKNITGIRALLPLPGLEIHEQKHRVRNEDGKIVGRLSILTHAASEDGARCYLLIEPLRGYAEERDSLSAMARKSGMKRLPCPLLEDLLLVHDIHPGDYSSKLDIGLRRTQTITEAALAIHGQLLSTMRSNIPGIIQDYDTEFLHDFRVATRRTRACLSQIKEAFPPAIAAEYNAGFKKIAQRCNVLRDLDVYLLEKQRYYDLLPQHLHQGLDQYFAHIKRRRKAQHKSFADFLQTKTFASTLENWGAFLESPQTPAGSPPAIEVARSRIRDRFRKIIKKGRKISTASPDKDLHSLRIDCKRLRYLLEFFASLFPAKKMDRLIKHMKGLQDNLGEFNDLAVQQGNLSVYLARSGHNAPQHQLRSAAIGGLLAVLSNRQNEVREEFFHSFAEFDSKQVHTLCKELFGEG